MEVMGKPSTGDSQIHFKPWERLKPSCHQVGASSGANWWFGRRRPPKRCPPSTGPRCTLRCWRVTWPCGGTRRASHCRSSPGATGGGGCEARNDGEISMKHEDFTQKHVHLLIYRTINDWVFKVGKHESLGIQLRRWACWFLDHSWWGENFDRGSLRQSTGNRTGMWGFLNPSARDGHMLIARNYGSHSKYIILHGDTWRMISFSQFG